jgi:hypothetical protein
MTKGYRIVNSFIDNIILMTRQRNAFNEERGESQKALHHKAGQDTFDLGYTGTRRILCHRFHQMSSDEREYDLSIL